MLTRASSRCSCHGGSFGPRMLPPRLIAGLRAPGAAHDPRVYTHARASGTTQGRKLLPLLDRLENRVTPPILRAPLRRSAARGFAGNVSNQTSLKRLRLSSMQGAASTLPRISDDFLCRCIGLARGRPPSHEIALPSAPGRKPPSPARRVLLNLWELPISHAGSPTNTSRQAP
jgi:hypothetical protein